MDSCFNGIADLFRENTADIGKCISSFDTGNHISKPGTFLMCTVIFEKLYRDFSVSGFPGSALQFSLQSDSAENSLFRKIRRVYRNDDSTVGIMAVTCLIAHTIHCKHIFFRRCIYNISAGTHTERINATSVFQCMGNFVAGCTQTVVFRFSVKIPVDHGLRMLHAYPHRKRFRLHIYIVFIQHGKCISGAVAGSKNTDFCWYFLFCIDNDCVKLPVTDYQISYGGTKTEFPTHFFNLMTHKLNDTYKLICAKMRLLLVKDLGRSSCLHKSGKNLPSSSKSIFYQSVQLSIGKSPCTALSELYIGIRIQDAVFPEIFHGFLSFVCLFSPFQYQWTVPGFGQVPGTE